jgi:hypothetical protein
LAFGNGIFACCFVSLVFALVPLRRSLSGAWNVVLAGPDCLAENQDGF